MSNMKYLEMEDIAYKEWSDHLDFVASSRASPWLPAYGYHPPSPIQEIFQTQPDPFLSDNSSVNQQQYLVLETIVEETSDDLCSESDKSGPTGWNSDSDTDSVIHLPKIQDNVENWRSPDCSEEVPKKRRRRIVDKFSASDDDDEPVESNSLSSRSSSLIAFESLEKHCEDVFIGGTSINLSGTAHGIPRWTAVSPDSPRESVDEFDSSDEEHCLGSSVDTLHRSLNAHGVFRSSLPADTRLRSYRSFDSLNLFESIPWINSTLSELSQSHSALNCEKEKQQEQEFVIRGKKLTATTADLSTMTDPYDTGLKGLGFTPRRRQDAASFHYKESVPYRNAGTSSLDKNKRKRSHFPTKRKSYSAEALKLQSPPVVANRKDEVDDENRGRSEPCLMDPPKSNPSVENLSEDSGFDDQILSRGKMNLVNFRNSVSSIPEDEDVSSPLESSSSNFSDCNGSEEGSLVSTEGRESKALNKSVVSSKIAEEQEQPGVSGNLGIKDDVEVKFNPGQNQTDTFNSSRKKEGLNKRGEVEDLIATPSVPFASLTSNESSGSSRTTSEFGPVFAAGDDLDALKGPDNHFESRCFPKEEFTVCTSLHEFPYESMSAKLEKNNPSRLPVLSTPNLLAGVDDLVREVPLAASSLTHVPLKCYDEDDLDGRIIRNNFLELKNNQLGSGFGGSQSSGGIRGVHFCPVVSEVSWQQDSYSETSTGDTSDSSTDEISNRSLEELCGMQDDEEEFHQVEEKLIPRDRDGACNAQRKSFHGELEQDGPVVKFKCNSEMNLTKIDREDEGMNGSCRNTQRDRNPERISKKCLTVEEQKKRDGTHLNVNSSCSNGWEPCVKEKRVTPTIRVTPTSSGHVFIGDAAQPNAERRIRLSVSESNLPAQGHESEVRFEIDGRAYSDHAAASAKDMTMKKSKSRFGGFFERFSLRRLSNRKASAGNSKKQNGRKDDKKENDGCVGATTGTRNFNEEVLIIPLHGPDNEAEVNEIFRSVVTPHVVSAKPPLPPSFQRMSASSRKRFPIPTAPVPVGLQDDERDGGEIMPGVRGQVPADKDCTNGSLTCTPCCNAESNDQPVGLLETDLDTHVTVESGRRPLAQSNVGGNKKARSLMNLGLGDMSVHHDQQENLPLDYLEPSLHRSHGSVAVDDRAKSMEFLLDKENQAAVLPPENELQKGGTGERVMSEHQLRVQRSLQKLNIPDWYKSSAVSQTPQGFLLKRNSETRREHGWPGLGSKTTSLSSLGSSQSATARSPASQALSPSPTPHLFTRWSTSRLSSGLNSSSTSPSGSLRSSFNYRQPYLGWRSQERLTRPRTPAERLAAGLLPLQKQQQTSSQSSVNLSDVRTSIKEVTSAIVHYVSGVQENGSKEALRTYQAGTSPGSSPKRQSSPKGSTGRLCWVESSFVGSRPLDQPQTPLTLTEPSSAKPETRPTELYLDLTSRSEPTQPNGHRVNAGTPTVSEVSESQRVFEKETFEVRKRPSPTSTTLNDILESLLGLPPTSRSPSPGPLSIASSAAFSPGRSRPFLPLPERQHQRQSCGDIRANVSESASSPGNAAFGKETMHRRRKSDGGVSVGDHGTKRRGSSDHKGRKHGDNSGPEDPTRKEHPAQLADTLVKCRYSKCGKTATIPDAKRTFKTCHNCSHVYCSRECRRAHWERHRRICLHSRVGALCRQVLSAAKEDPKALHHLSMLARRGYLTHGRGAVKIFFSSPELAEKFVARGIDELGEPAYVKWSDLLPAEMGADLFAELVKICKSYNPDTRLVLYVAVCVVSEVPTTGAVKWERQLVSRCCKIGLDKSLVPPKEDKQVPPPLPPRKSSSNCIKITREMENPETLILTSLPGTAGKLSDQKIREISFVNIQRELKQRGVSLRRQFPEVYKKLCSYVEGTSDHFTPATIYPRDAVSGKTFMCIIMPDSEPEKLDLVPKDSTKVKTIDVSIERKSE